MIYIDKIQYISRKVNKLIQVIEKDSIILDKVIEEIANIFKSNVILINDNGRILKEVLDDDSLNISSSEKEFFIENHLNIQLNNIIDIKINIKLSKLYIKNIEHSKLDLYKAIIVPIYIVSKRKASIIIYKKNKNFCNDDLILLEVLSVFMTLIISHANSEVETEEIRKKKVVKSAIDTLSYSELEAILYIFDELKNDEGVLIASKIADKAGITRSVIVNAIRKLESAGIIESRSLGMKGTFIKVLNDKIIKEVNKIRN